MHFCLHSVFRSLTNVHTMVVFFFFFQTPFRLFSSFFFSVCLLACLLAYSLAFSHRRFVVFEINIKKKKKRNAEWNDAVKSVCDSSRIVEAKRIASFRIEMPKLSLVVGFWWFIRCMAMPKTSSFSAPNIYRSHVLTLVRSFVRSFALCTRSGWCVYVDWYKCIVFSAILTSDGEPFIVSSIHFMLRHARITLYNNIH